MVHPQGPGTRAARPTSAPVRGRRWWRRPICGLALRAGCLAVALAVAVRYPPGIVLAAAAAVWVLWPVYAVGRRAATAGRRRGARGGIPVRYLGGHPALRASGRGWLQAWPAEGAAILRVGRAAVPFPLAAVRSVALVDGRVEIPTGHRGLAAAFVGRVMARGMGRYCGLARSGREDAAIVDRSRVACEIARQGTSCRAVLIGPEGGGEEIYLDVLLLLRPGAALRGSGAAGGPRGTGSVGGT